MKHAVRPHRVVVLAPALDDDLGLLERVEDLAVEQLVAKLAVEAFIVVVLSWTPWLDVERANA